MISEKYTFENHKTMTINGKGKLLFLLFGLLFFLHGSLNATEVINNLNFDFYSQENGLSNNQIHCIHQDKKGWMWFGTCFLCLFQNGTMQAAICRMCLPALQV